jgi:selenide, water dikinase
VVRPPAVFSAIASSSARGAGCGCKLSPDLLRQALALMPALPADPDILVAHLGFDDAAAYRVREDLAVVASTDFFTPVVDDRATFGAIAATNAMSDLYAMGATPLFALSIVAYPKDGDPEGLAQILRGGAEAATAMGCPVLGGHSIDDPEIKYGLAVIGTAHPDELLTNAAGREDDLLVLTKPIGTGVAIASGRPSAVFPAVESMLRSNAAAALAAREAELTCATDVTGFGLLAHLRELALGSGFAAEVYAGEVPLLPEVAALAAEGIAPGGAARNRTAIAGAVEFTGEVPEALRTLLFDPQTSGGLLLSVAPARADALQSALDAHGVTSAVVGRLVRGVPGSVAVLAARPV